MRQFLRWEYLLCKRFFRRKSFLVLLLLLPLMGLLIRAGSREKSGILEIGIVAEEKEGKSSPLAASIAENLLQSESVLHYRSVKSESAARDLLRAGKLDAAWILPVDLETRVARMAAGKNIPLVDVLEREDSALVKLSRENLYRALFPTVSYEIYRNFLAENFDCDPDDPAFTKEIAARYAEIQIDGDLISYVNEGGREAAAVSYLRAPLRGMGALWLLLMSFVALLYYLEDLRQGMFDFVPRAAQRRYALRYLIAVQGLASLAFLALLLAGGLGLAILLVLVHPAREIAALLLLNLLCLLLVMSIGILTRGKRSLLIALLLPLLLLSLIGAPVFLDLGIRALELANPLYYYLKFAA
mgnify:CR=1 FL=1